MRYALLLLVLTMGCHPPLPLEERIFGCPFSASDLQDNIDLYLGLWEDRFGEHSADTVEAGINNTLFGCTTNRLYTEDGVDSLGIHSGARWIRSHIRLFVTEDMVSSTQTVIHHELTHEALLSTEGDSGQTHDLRSGWRPIHDLLIAEAERISWDEFLNNME